MVFLLPQRNKKPRSLCLSKLSAPAQLLSEPMTARPISGGGGDAFSFSLESQEMRGCVARAGPVAFKALQCHEGAGEEASGRRHHLSFCSCQRASWLPFVISWPWKGCSRWLITIMHRAFEGPGCKLRRDQAKSSCI
jgi:hypothetical protein